MEGISDTFEIIKANPANCARLFEEGKADIALVPVGALPDLKRHRIITDYCIGCDGTVRTVVIFSNEKLSEIKKLYLDPDSRTSVKLGRLLLAEYFTDCSCLRSAFRGHK